MPAYNTNGASRPRLVVIEDDMAIVSLVCAVFDAEGWVVMPCPHGPSAMAMLRESRPDVVLLDIRLDTPRRGWEILRELRQTNWGRCLPVVVCSALAGSGEWPDGLDRSAVGIVGKPFELEELVSSVRRWVGDRLDPAPSRYVEALVSSGAPGWRIGVSKSPER